MIPVIKTYCTVVLLFLAIWFLLWGLLLIAQSEVMGWLYLFMGLAYVALSGACMICVRLLWRRK